ncbi:hypothetical protein DYBT9275_05973 [Dyadobacter sp. CECT 9275]|uniref:Response regulatory domain-containing protein n=1 Tax=Dyadobacter helix TaxID=2822344 RepID=A0A916JKI0_9BACT|nr:hypothetical protein [Dyadobacter sp. CECT 9275]CAG5018295.1 hypothetical protein DYBT9275_05973 [Dyadobacter sp. CECT 9275]
MKEVLHCLLIDDDADDQEIFLFALQQAFPDMACSIAFDCLEATKKLNSREIPVPDYIFLDWMLPLMEAEDCIRQLQLIPELERTCTFILSGSEPFISAENLRLLKIKKIIRKQYDINELARKIAEAILEVSYPDTDGEDQGNC